jgi:hypothetical protein
LLQLTVESRDLSQAVKKLLLLQAEQIHPMTTLFNQFFSSRTIEFSQLVTTIKKSPW